MRCARNYAFLDLQQGLHPAPVVSRFFYRLTPATVCRTQFFAAIRGVFLFGISVRMWRSRYIFCADAQTHANVCGGAWRMHYAAIRETPVTIGGCRTKQYIRHDTGNACYHRWMQYEAMSCFATSTRGSVLLYTTEETQSARHEIDRNAPPPVVFLLYAYGK